MTGLDATRYYVCASVLLSLISNQRLYRWDEGEIPMADLNIIREILLQHWDPIGVGDAPDAVDEYDHYAIKILQMLEAEEGRDRIDDERILRPSPPPFLRSSRRCLHHPPLPISRLPKDYPNLRMHGALRASASTDAALQ